jgi:hypothetical protein
MVSSMSRARALMSPNRLSMEDVLDGDERMGPSIRSADGRPSLYEGTGVAPAVSA